MTRHTLFFVICLGFASACDDPVYYNIDDAKIPLLQDGDSAIFENTSDGIRDTFVVFMIDHYVITDKRYHRRDIVMAYRKTSSTNYLFWMKQRPDSLSILWEPYYLKQTETIPAMKFTNGTTLTDILHYEHGNEAQGTFHIYYHYKQGIVRYTDPSGATAELTSFRLK